ncbi:hypothetical protein [uncultured Nocardioides sp.]|uniref:hypothetical protein n=1 Tax=uncultured Nocardioides sp. TaxID=198441 RepID=UPI000C6B57D1|nr:hypothetical protein [uncultured Nocardioides sp.]MAO80134.1 hypothetical protein [Nocardioides sp.]|tara:strand:+ start:92 stop:760 length:669 start_codon:yes stop_codon:yes gene_type:complete
MPRSLRLLVAATALALSTSVASPALSAAPHSAAAPETAAKAGKPCNAKGFKSKVKDVKGSPYVALTRLTERTWPGKHVIKKQTTFSSSKSNNFSAKGEYKASASVKASGLFKKVVSIYGEANAATYLTTKLGSTSKESYDITVYKKQVIPKATSVVIYAGRLAARGTAKYSYCSALEGSGEGYVKWGKMRWNSYGPRGTGAQRCDLKAQAKIAAAAKSAMCV